MHKLFQRIATCLSVYLSTCLLLPSPVYAWTEDKDGVATLKSFQSLFTLAVGVILRLVGLGMFVMIIVGGFKILTAGGDAKAMDAGKQTITMAIIGLVLAVASWFILLAIKAFTGVDLTTFTFGLPD